MKRLFILCLIASFAMISVSGVLAESRLKMSTTTSTENSGLLKVLLPPFEKPTTARWTSSQSEPVRL